MLILMLKTQLSNRILSLSLCSPSALLPFTSKGLYPFVRNAIFLFRTRSVNKILSPLTPVVFYPVFFPPFFSLSSLPPRGWFSRSLTFCLLGFFPLQGKMASIYFFTFISLLLFLRPCQSFYPARLAKCILDILSHTWLFDYILYSVNCPWCLCQPRFRSYVVIIK